MTSRAAILALAALGTAALLPAETVTLPAAASIVGGAPFFSDVRAFNPSYSDPLDVTATYRCFIGDPCPAAPPTLSFRLAPRQSIGFDDVVAAAFNAPDTAGGIEFAFAGDATALVVTSRLYSTAPVPTVGMYIPGLTASSARERTVLTSIRNGGAGQGFRTNVGLFNPGDAPVTATFEILGSDGVSRGNPVTRSVAGRSGVQVSAIFAVAGAADFETENAAITVVATGPVFSYAAVIDNATTDPIFVIGAPDALPGTPTITRTPTMTFTPSVTFTPSLTFTASLTPTITPTFTVTPTFTISQTPTITLTPTITRTPIITNLPSRTPTINPNHIVLIGQNGTTTFYDVVSGTTNSTITVGTTVEWQWVSGYHSTTSGSCTTGCTKNFIWDSANHNAPYVYRFTFNQAGTYGYYCMQHGAMMQGAVNVVPPSSPALRR